MYQFESLESDNVARDDEQSHILGFVMGSQDEAVDLNNRTGVPHVLFRG